MSSNFLLELRHSSLATEHYSFGAGQQHPLSNLSGLWPWAEALQTSHRLSRLQPVGFGASYLHDPCHIIRPFSCICLSVIPPHPTPTIDLYLCGILPNTPSPCQGPFRRPSASSSAVSAFRMFSCLFPP